MDASMSPRARGNLAKNDEPENGHRGPSTPRLPVGEDMEHAAIAHHEAGRLAQAKQLYEQILAVNPRHPGALHRMGLLAFQVGRPDLALGYLNQALQAMPHADVHFHRGLVLQSLGANHEAGQSYHAALAANPDLPSAHLNLGGLYKLEGKLDEAAHHYTQALRLQSDFPPALSNLGNVFLAKGKVADAVPLYRSALAIDPDFADAHVNLANALLTRGEVDRALEHFQRALSLDSRDVDAHNGVAAALIAKGKTSEALAACERSLAIKETDEAKRLIVRCFGLLEDILNHPKLRHFVGRAISEPWGRPTHFISAGVTLLQQNSGLQECVQRAITAWPSTLGPGELFQRSGLIEASMDPLLLSMLETVPLAEVNLERLFTMVRAIILSEALDATGDQTVEAPAFAFYCAIARQCFLNDYVFSAEDDEISKAETLRANLADAIAQDAQIPPVWIAGVASYFPLHLLADSERLLARPWPQPIKDLLMQQVEEPLVEARGRASIKTLTPTVDTISCMVREQYEDNPYPRWTKSRPPVKQKTLDATLAEDFPHAKIRPLNKYESIDILIAGCGTGQQSIETARRFVGANVLAIDLSLSSLCHARRKTEELGLQNIEYMQGDILNFASIGRSFDYVESIGVLHHLGDPAAGLKVLTSLLRPGGFMQLGLYSELGRQDIVAARRFIASKGYRPTAIDIRRCRQELLAHETSTLTRRLVQCTDFFTTSGCRDLLFHVQEHRFTLPAIEQLLRSLDLDFVGFRIDPPVAAQYRDMFPRELTQTDLGNWNELETRFPDTFRSMYQFCVQRRA